MDERKIKRAIDTLRNIPYTKENEKFFNEVKNIIAEKKEYFEGMIWSLKQ